MSQPATRDLILQELDAMPPELQLKVHELLQAVLATATAAASASSAPGSSGRHPGLLKMVREGRARLGRPNAPDLYPEGPITAPAGLATRLLNEERGER